MRASGVITLTTDFGTSDAYAGAMKGVILSINPHAKIVDITHDVRPQQIEQGAFLLAGALPYFAPGAVHVAVVDPGVGTERSAMALVTPNSVLVGPDNGILSVALPDDGRFDTGVVALPAGFTAVRLTNEAFFRRPVSSAFHGRDIFAPVGAYLSLGVDVSRFGEKVDSIQSLRPFAAEPLRDGTLRGSVLHIDHFGNLITDVRAVDLPPDPAVEIAGREIPSIARTYHAAEGLLALIGSAGYLEVAVRDGSAAALLGADIGTPVIVRPR